MSMQGSIPDPPSRHHLSRASRDCRSAAFDHEPFSSELRVELLRPNGAHAEAFDRSSRSTLRLSTGLRRIIHTIQPSLLGALDK